MYTGNITDASKQHNSDIKIDLKSSMDFLQHSE